MIYFELFLDSNRIKQNESEVLENLLDINKILVDKMDSLAKFRLAYILIALLLSVFLFLFNNENEFLVLFKNVFLTFLIIYFGIYFPLVKSMEKKRIGAVIDSTHVLIDRLNQAK